ncbi:recombinase family protein, partial [Alkaliphilus transvaalensis]|uniref:recombinase family protein n=1 Tax=Alkaliphilus transvaalensis TaxID=114628 RepID=UPI00047A7C48
MNKTAVGYVRVSTKNQVKEGYSLSYQVEEIRNYCYAHDIHLLSIYTDEGISGAKVDEEELTIDREELQSMLTDIKALEVDYIVVLNTSRLWRSDLVKVLIQRELRAVGVDIKAIEQETYSIYTNDPSDFLVNGMMELLDQYQRL